jgi:hypothetical protein
LKYSQLIQIVRVKQRVPANRELLEKNRAALTACGPQSGARQRYPQVAVRILRDLDGAKQAARLFTAR